MTDTDTTPGIIGRERFLLDKLAKLVHTEVAKHHETTALYQARRGNTFDVRVLVADEATGHVARITIELERFEAPT